MERAKVIFGRGQSTISKIILFVTRSKWSHVAYIDQVSGYLIEAAGGIGVIVSTYEDFCKKYPDTKIAEIPTYNANIFRSRMIDTIGSDYDFNAILGILLRRDWDEADKWTCSEAIAHASQIFRKEKLFRITQEHIFMISRDSDFDFSNTMVFAGKVPTKHELASLAYQKEN